MNKRLIEAKLVAEQIVSRDLTTRIESERRTLALLAPGDGLAVLETSYKRLQDLVEQLAQLKSKRSPVHQARVKLAYISQYELANLRYYCYLTPDPFITVEDCQLMYSLFNEAITQALALLN